MKFDDLMNKKSMQFQNTGHRHLKVNANLKEN